MDRRLFLKSLGVTAAGAAISEASDSFATTHVASGIPSEHLRQPSRSRETIASSDLSPWNPSTTQPWDVHTINHLYRRAGFGATLGEIYAITRGIVVQTPSQVVDNLLRDSLLLQPTVPPIPGNADDGKTPSLPPAWLRVPPYVYNDPIKIQTDYANANMKIRSHWTVQMNQPEVMLREKLVLFWMNHFVVEAKKVYYPQSMYSLLTYFRQNAWGNFKKMVSDVTISPAMLIYLDGVLNAGSAPNENYARELQELFTMGVVDKNGNPNYTQDDVEGIAHALTGWTVDAQAPPPDVLPSKYEVTRHDSSFQKIYDGVKRQYNLTASGASMDMDLIDHIFDQRGDQIAWYICSKLYQYFVYHDVSGDSEKAVIGAMADLFKSSNWELKPVLSALLKSAHFFDEANIGAEIKSPYDHLIGLLRTFEIPINELSAGSLYFYAVGGSQILLDPPNVKGWPGYHSWISTTTLPYRGIIETLLVFSNKSLPAVGTDGYGNAHLPINLPQEADLVKWGKQFDNYSGTFDDMLSELGTYLCAHTPSATALKYIKGQFPPQTYEWNLLDDSTKVKALLGMATALMLLADYQLC